MKKATAAKKPLAAAVNTASITERAMLICLSVGYWTGKVTDDQVVDELTKGHNTEKDVHDYRRRLVKKEAIAGFKSVRSRARAFLFDKTLPWIDGGTRILPAPLYFDVAKKLQEFRAEWDNEVAAFIKAYPDLKKSEKARQGTLYREDDYPTVERLRRKFGWDMHVFPIPSRADWRVELGAGEVAAVQKQIDEKVTEALQLATKDLWKRLYTVVEALSAKLHEADPTFRDSIIGNIRELVALLPQMNVANDPKLEQMRVKIDEQLAKLNPEDLRNDEKARKSTRDAADKLLEMMSGYVGNGN